MLSEAMIREGWLRAEALCECRKDAHGHPGGCNQFLIWAERGKMPTPVDAVMHPDAKITVSDRKPLCDWSGAARKALPVLRIRGFSAPGFQREPSGHPSSICQPRFRRKS